jgi:hypothetical protein
MRSSLKLILLLAATTIPVTAVSAATTPAPCTQGNALSVMVTAAGGVTGSRTDAAVTGTAVAYLPNGDWQDFGGSVPAAKGIRVVPLEGTGIAKAKIPTPGYVDSCAANSVTQQTVCIDTSNVVYLINGTTAEKLKSSGRGNLSFSGGDCTNCSVAIDTITNTAYIEESVTSKAGTSAAIQALDLTTKTFLTPFKLKNGATESIVVDPNNNLILSANEGGNGGSEIYDLITLDPDTGAPLKEYGNQHEENTAEYDSGGEDCTTGIALATDEFSGDLFLANLNTRIYHGKYWGDPQERLINFPQFDQISTAGTTGLSVAPGTHYAVLGGEFGGGTIGFLEMPATAELKGTGLRDFVTVTMPNDPKGDAFAFGYDPHSVTSYTSPNNGKAYAVVADWSTGEPEYLAVIDIAAMMAAPRITSSYSNGKHVVDPTYDLIAHHIVRFIKTD